MTDRYKGLQVTFEQNIRSDDAEAIINAILMLRGVQDVRPSVFEGEDTIIQIRTTQKIRQRIAQVLVEEFS